ncbi:MAG: hypothetical protein INR62_03295 [Rhodospirillales bacterium]|nr:hypothetical protein [Acetobacter sp.]
MAKAVVALPGLTVPLPNSQFRLAFDGNGFDIDRFSSRIGEAKLLATYRFDPAASVPERVSVKLSRADLSELQGLAVPVLRPSSLLARLGVLRRSMPDWMRSLNLQGDIAVDHLDIGNQAVGSLTTLLQWQGTDIRFPRFRLHLPDGVAEGAASLDVRGPSPKYEFEGNLSNVAWRGGQVTASGVAQAAGTGAELFRSLQASGNFSGQDLRLSPEDSFSKLQGAFDLTFDQGWPDLHLNAVTALQDGVDWTGQAESQSDGTLLLDLTREGQQRHIVSTLSFPQPSALSLFVRPVVRVSEQEGPAF